MHTAVFACIAIVVLADMSQDSTIDTSDGMAAFIDTAVVSTHGRVVSVDLVECSFVLKTGEEEITVFADNLTKFPDGMKFADMKSNMDLRILCRIVNEERFARVIDVIENITEPHGGVRTMSPSQTIPRALRAATVGKE